MGKKKIKFTKTLFSVPIIHLPQTRELPPNSASNVSKRNQKTHENQDPLYRKINLQHDSMCASDTYENRQSAYQSLCDRTDSINLCGASNNTTQVRDIPLDHKPSYSNVLSNSGKNRSTCYEPTYSNTSSINTGTASSIYCPKKYDNISSKSQLHRNFFSNCSGENVGFRNAYSNSTKLSKFPTLSESQGMKAGDTASKKRYGKQSVGHQYDCSASDNENFEEEFDMILKCIGYSEELSSMINFVLEKKKGYSTECLLSKVNSRQDLIDSLCVCEFRSDKGNETRWKSKWDFNDYRDDWGLEDDWDLEHDWNFSDDSDESDVDDYNDEWDMDKDLEYICPYHFLLICVSHVLELEESFKSDSLTERSLSSCDGLASSMSSGYEKSSCDGEEVEVVNNLSYSDKKKVVRDASRKQESKNKHSIVKAKGMEKGKIPNESGNLGNFQKRKRTSKEEVTEEGRETIRIRVRSESGQNAVKEPKAKRKAKVKRKKARILREIKQCRIRKNSQSTANLVE